MGTAISAKISREAHHCGGDPGSGVSPRLKHELPTETIDEIARDIICTAEHSGG